MSSTKWIQKQQLKRNEKLNTTRQKETLDVSIDNSLFLDKTFPNNHKLTENST